MNTDAYTIELIAQVTGGKLVLQNQETHAVQYLLTDSRKVVNAAASLFFAIKGDRRDGHEFIFDLHQTGVRNFVVASDEFPSKYPDSSFIVCSQPLAALQKLAAYHRSRFTFPVTAITGSNGKTTTTALTFHICKHAGEDCAMVGNIGYSFAKQVVEDPKALYVVEVSSFQLDDIKTFKPDVAVLTNITEDHLDRYDYKLQNYVASKFRIAAYQTEEDVFIYNLDDETTMKNINTYPIKSTKAPITMSKELPQGAYLMNAKMHLKWKSEEMQMSVEDFAIKGKHNQYNSMAASMAATAIDIRKEKIREALQTFESLEHRMESVSIIKGVEFINDSKATNVNSTWFALESMTKPVILILGGVDKGNDYNLLKELVKEKVRGIVCMGTDNRKIHEAFGDVVPLMVNTESAKEAVQAAFHFANKGDVVLLSPACASFDLFKNYEDRGNQFKQAVKNL